MACDSASPNGKTDRVSVEASAGVLGESGARSARGSAPSWWAFLGPVGVAKILAIVALLSWLYGDHFYRLFRYWQDPDWSHGFLLPLFCLYLVHAKRSELLTGDHRGSLFGLPLMILAGAGYAIAISRQYGYPQPLSILCMLAGLVLLLRGWRSLWLTAFPIAFLFLAIPPPTRLYRAFTQPLQQLAAIVSAFVLQVFPGVRDITRQGFNLEFYMEDGTDGGFAVAGACSGMRSLMAFVALGLAMAYVTRRPLWHRVALAVLVVPVAISCNILRVIVTGSFQMYGHSELASGTPHTILGLLMFALGFMMYSVILWGLDHIFVEETEGDADRESRATGAVS